MGGRGLPIRRDVSAAELRRSAVREEERGKARRMMAIANALEGMTRAEAEHLAGMERQALRDAAVGDDAEGLAGLCDRPRPGPRPRLDEGRRVLLRALVLAGPDVERTGLSTWTPPELCREVEARWGVGYDPSWMGKLLHRPGLCRGRRRGRPSRRRIRRHAMRSQKGAPGRPRCRAGGASREAPDAPVPGQARFGQKGRVCHRCFTRGVHPPGLCDQRYTWAHLFAAVRPTTGEDSALVLPHVSTAAMNIFLERFAATRATDEHAALVLDGAGWHTANDLQLPDNVTLVPLPPYSPEPNPIGRAWLHLRERHLSHRLLDDDDDVVDALCRAWTSLTPQRRRSFTNYPYPQQVRIEAGRCDSPCRLGWRPAGVARS